MIGRVHAYHAHDPGFKQEDEEKKKGEEQEGCQEVEVSLLLSQMWQGWGGCGSGGARHGGVGRIISQEKRILWTNIPPKDASPCEYWYEKLARRAPSHTYLLFSSSDPPSVIITVCTSDPVQ